MRILGIETSCDETAIALYDSEKGLVGHALHSQTATHRPYGGVVPELASRDHIQYLIPLMDEVLNQAKLSKHDLDAIAYTAGPGLIGALLTGACFAKSLALSLTIPALAIHHLEAHLLAAQLDTPTLNFPFLVLLVSGGHTQLILAKALGVYQILGETLDDAVGEAFDKTAKLMDLAYPGGPALAELARHANLSVVAKLPSFPRPMTDRPGLDFSFSGLKTHILTVWNASDKTAETKAAIAWAFQQAVVDTLVIKCKRALKQTNHSTIVVAGGVGANQMLRKTLKEVIQEIGGKIYFPPPEYCTDNGAMVAYAGYLHYLAKKIDRSYAIEVKARWPLTKSVFK